VVPLSIEEYEKEMHRKFDKDAVRTRLSVPNNMSTSASVNSPTCNTTKYSPEI